MIFSAAFLFAFVTSLLLAVVIVSTQHIHGHLTLDGQSGVQKLHKQPTPRIGGLALLAGVLAGGISLPIAVQPEWWLIALSASPAFLFGFWEDLSKGVGVKTRLMATICAGLIFCVLTGYHVTRVDIPGADWVLSFWLPSLLLTAFAIGGIANAINIIDGVNGLASGTSIIILSGFAVVAFQTGDHELAGICLVICGAHFGFFLMNFPMGRIFLGDAGAYATGFFLAVIAVALPLRNPELSPLIGLLALSYPVIETIVSIHRRLSREGAHPYQADRLHLHSLIYRSRALQLAQALGVPQLRNAIASLLVMILPLLSTGAMLIFNHSSAWCMVAMAVMAFLYIFIYRKVALLGRTGLFRDSRSRRNSTAPAA